MDIFYSFRLDKGIIASACVRLSAFFWLFLATAYTIPAKNPSPIADTDPKVTTSPKNNMPDAATGNLLSAPTILYVVLLVVRIHHAVVYDMPTAAAPENAMANRRKLRLSSGKLRIRFSELQFSTKIEKTTRTGIDSKLL